MPWHARSLAVGSLVAICAATVSCDDSPNPTFPAPPPTPPAQSLVTLSGVVFDHTPDGPSAMANIPLVVRVLNANVFREVTSDAMGRYSLSGIPHGAISISATGGSGYYSPCPSGWDVVKSDRVFDVHVVSATLLSTSGAPASMPRLGGIWVSGVVFEITPQGRKPIAGATVTLAGDGSDRTGSTTLTDADGRYLVCPPIPSTGTDQTAPLRISREGYRTVSGSVFLGWDYTGVDIELIRN